MLAPSVDAAAVEAGAEVLDHGEQPEDAAVLRHLARCRAAPAGAARSPAMSRPSKLHLALGRADQAHDGLERGALADAVAPEQAHDLARARPRARRRAGCGSCRSRCGCVDATRGDRSRRSSRLEVHLLHARVGLDLGRRALGQDLAVVQHGDAVGRAPSPPACRARRSGWSGPSRCGGPAPWCRGSPPRSCPRSARRGRGAAARWRARCRSRGCAARRARGWRPARRPCRARPTDASTASALLDDVAVRAMVVQQAPAVPARLGGDAHVLERGGVGQDVGDLVGARDALLRDAVGRQPGDVLAVEDDAARRSGRSTPVRQLKNVLLPAPFGPMMARISPRRDLEVDVVERGQPAEADGQALGARGSGGGARPRPAPAGAPRR